MYRCCQAGSSHPRTSMSIRRGAFGGISPFTPLGPYPYEPAIHTRQLSPARIVLNAKSRPRMTPPRPRTTRNG